MTGQRKTYHYDRLGRVTEHHHYPITVDSELPPIINYNEQSYEPIAKLISDHQPQTDEIKQQIQYFHTLANSLPTELTNQQGQIIWQADYQLFGQIKRQHNRHDIYSTDKIEQNLRFAGQYYDNETGLHYNTFRYYDPNCGRFTQPDPIGLAGGINLYQYAPNTLTWIDPWGFICHKHHSDPKFARGDPKQPLTIIDEDIHRQLHKEMNEFLFKKNKKIK